MNTKNFIELLNNENAVRDVDLKQLDSVLENFPYFQSARMLYLRNLKINNNFMFNSYLRTTASYVGDRTVLFEYITKESDDFDVEEIVVKAEETTKPEEIIVEFEAEVVDEVEEEAKKEIEEENLDTHKAISFSSNDRFSFNEWLQLSNVKEIHRRIDEKIEASGKKEVSSETG
ncbi:MAG: hypothetical protein KAG37_08595, partial [Flavobacteriales bacterium]|nr:hypothetical protein [Flavobacteriales bacterium]